jgi:hypothetical protein
MILQEKAVESKSGEDQVLIRQADDEMASSVGVEIKYG